MVVSLPGIPLRLEYTKMILNVQLIINVQLLLKAGMGAISLICPVQRLLTNQQDTLSSLTTFQITETMLFGRIQ